MLVTLGPMWDVSSLSASEILSHVRRGLGGEWSQRRSKRSCAVSASVGDSIRLPRYLPRSLVELRVL